MSEVKQIKVYQPKAILIQMFGLMSPERWREETGLPFVKANMKEFLLRKKKDGKVLIRIEGLRAIARLNAEVDEAAPQIEEDTVPAEEVISSVIAFLHWQSARGRSNKATKSLENMLISDGMERALLKLTIYEDVLPALTTWHEQGCKIFVDCPHLTSEEAKLYLKNTNLGDIAHLIQGFYGNDKLFMTSEAGKSYQNILTAIGCPISDMLFITYIGQRAKQMADDFKVPILLVDRNDNRKIRKYYLFRFRCVFKLTQTRFVKRSAVKTTVLADSAGKGSKTTASLPSPSRTQSKPNH